MIGMQCAFDSGVVICSSQVLTRLLPWHFREEDGNCGNCSRVFSLLAHKLKEEFHKVHASRNGGDTSDWVT